MKILMLTPYLPYPPSEGGQVRSYNLIKLLSRRHDLTLVCFTRQHNTQEQIDHIKKYCKKVIVIERGKTWTLKNILRTGFSVYPFLVGIYYSSNTREILSKEINSGKYDLIHAETFYTLPFLPPHTLPIVLVEQTIMSRIFGHHVKIEKRWWLKPFMWIDVAKIRYWEKYFWERVNKVVTVSEEDATVINTISPKTKPDVVPNGVGEDFSKLPTKLHYNHTLLYMANYKWIQNWEAVELLAKTVYPLIKKAIPDLELLITGQFPTQQVKSLEGNGIRVVELKEDDKKGVVDAYLHSGLMVAPMYAPGGTRLKILAAMASMVPVVTTPIGAEGYGAVDGESIVLGKTPEELAQRSIEIFKDKNLYKKVAIHARKLVDTKFSWEPIADKLESMYAEIVTSKN